MFLCRSIGWGWGGGQGSARCYFQCTAVKKKKKKQLHYICILTCTFCEGNDSFSILGKKKKKVKRCICRCISPLIVPFSVLASEVDWLWWRIDFMCTDCAVVGAWCPDGRTVGVEGNRVEQKWIYQGHKVGGEQIESAGRGDEVEDSETLLHITLFLTRTRSQLDSHKATINLQRSLTVFFTFFRSLHPWLDA